MRTQKQKDAFALLDQLIVGAKHLSTAKKRYRTMPGAFDDWMRRHPNAGLVTHEHFAAIISLLRAAVK